MLVLLPPSESKASRARGRTLELDELSYPELTDGRRRVLAALAAASARPDALDVLGAPRSAAPVVADQTDPFAVPTLPAAELYTGVLYDALDLPTLDPAAKRRASRWLVVVSALFGALRPVDRVPPYRLSMGVDLPDVGPLARHWAPLLDPVLTARAGRGLVVDLRSATYAAAWRPSGEVAERTVAVHVVRDGPGGRTAVSHMAKHTRGLVARTIVAEGIDPRTPADLAAALGERFDVGLDAARPGRPRRLEVVEP